MPEGEPKHEKEEKGDLERTSGLMRVAGVSPRTEKKIKGDIKEVFDFQDVAELKGIEIEKNAEQTEIIQAILTDLPGFLKDYGCDSPLPIRPEHIHLLDWSKLPEEKQQSIGEDVGGYYATNRQGILIFMRAGGSRVAFSAKVAHELVHFNSFQSANYNPTEYEISDRVIGVQVSDEAFYHDTNEAVTEELSKRFCRKSFELIPALSKDLEEIEKGIAGIVTASEDEVEDAIDLQILSRQGGNYTARIIRFPYGEERARLWKMMKEIQLKNPEEFESAEDVFKVFAKAYFNGKRLELARLIEKTYGKGSFRDLGEKTKRK